MCKRIFKFELQLSSYSQNINFHDIAPNFTFSQISLFFKYICNFLEQLLHPYKFHGRDMSGILFFIFASCHPLMSIDIRLVGNRQSMLLAVFLSLPGSPPILLLLLLWRLVALLSSYCVFTPFGCFTPCYHCCLAYDIFLLPFVFIMHF